MITGMKETRQNSRWAGFSDEELQELRYATVERRENRALPHEVRERAGVLAVEMHKERRYRESERTSYRGPGLYRRRDGFTESVLGVAVHETDLGRRMLVVLRRPDDATPSAHFTAVPIEYFDGCEDDGSRRFTYVEAGSLADGL